MDTVEKFALAGIVAICLLGVLFVGAMIYSETDAYQRPVYAAWCKANPSSKLTFEEWNLLRGEHLLAGQSKNDGSLATGMMLGVAIGSAGK
jgi:hypothetical protein